MSELSEVVFVSLDALLEVYGSFIQKWSQIHIVYRQICKVIVSVLVSEPEIGSVHP